MVPAFIESRSYGRGVLKDESKDSPFKLPTLSPKAGLGTFKPPAFVSSFPRQNCPLDRFSFSRQDRFSFSRQNCPLDRFSFSRQNCPLDRFSLSRHNCPRQNCLLDRFSPWEKYNSTGNRENGRALNARSGDSKVELFSCKF